MDTQYFDANEVWKWLLWGQLVQHCGNDIDRADFIAQNSETRTDPFGRDVYKVCVEVKQFFRRVQRQEVAAP